MSVTADFGLLSGAGSQSLQSFYSTKANRQVLNGINGGFNSSSIFSNSSGLSGVQSASTGFSELTGKVPGRMASLYSGSGFGMSLIGNYYNSISSVVLGQQAPTSVFEQRLAYATGHTTTPNIDFPNGNYSNLFESNSSGKSSSVSTTSSTNKSSSSYNVFSTTPKYDYSKATSASSTSQLMSSFSKLSVMG